MNWDEVIAFARAEHTRFLAEVIAAESEADEPIAHVYQLDKGGAVSVFALAFFKDPNLREFETYLRTILQAKILLEGVAASVYSGIVLAARAPTPELAKTIIERSRTDADFLESLEQEIGLQYRECVLTIGEAAGRQFVREQFIVRRDGRAHVEEEASEYFDEGAPRLPFTCFKWPR